MVFYLMVYGCSSHRVKKSFVSSDLKLSLSPDLNAAFQALSSTLPILLCMASDGW